MREIKFRAWDITENPPCMEYCGLERLGGYHEPMGHQIMQYTGLKDKNGKEIYEGDIVSLKGQWIDAAGPAGLDGVENHEVKWTDEFCGFFPFCLYDSDCGVSFDAGLSKVIGNIYENPELLP